MYHVGPGHLRILSVAHKLAWTIVHGSSLCFRICHGYLDAVFILASKEHLVHIFRGHASSDRYRCFNVEHGDIYLETESPAKRKALAKMILTGKTYDVLKNVAQIWLPAAGTLYVSLSQVWGFPAAEQISLTVLAVDTFLGVILGISSAVYNASDRKYDGTLTIQDGEDGSTLRLSSVDAKALNTKNEVVFKIVAS